MRVEQNIDNHFPDHRKSALNHSISQNVFYYGHIMIMSLFILPTQKISLKLIPFWSIYEQGKYQFRGFHDQNIFQSIELAV